MGPLLQSCIIFCLITHLRQGYGESSTFSFFLFTFTFRLFLFTFHFFLFPFHPTSLSPSLKLWRATASLRLFPFYFFLLPFAFSFLLLTFSFSLFPFPFFLFSLYFVQLKGIIIHEIYLQDYHPELSY